MSDDVFLSVSAEPNDWWTVQRGLSPIVATAIHNGSHVRDDLLSGMKLSAADRLREEDPFTEYTIRDVANRVVFHRSRFEVDLNRARSGAVYLKPEQAWGLDIWKAPPAETLVDRSLLVHDDYYAMLASLLQAQEKLHGQFVVLDIHSYNHRRGGVDADPTDSADAPEINIGTASMDRARWAHVLDPFIAALRSFDYRGRPLDVRENVAFQGKGEQTRFIHEQFPGSGCAIAVEFKKIFMDEWTGEPDTEALVALRALIRSTLPVLEHALRDGR